MGYILLSLVGGIAVGYFFPPGKSGLKNIQRLTTAGLFILLAAMGVQLGANSNILANLDKMGMQAVLLASLAVLGSIVAVYAVFRWPNKDRKDKGSAEESGR